MPPVWAIVELNHGRTEDTEDHGEERRISLRAKRDQLPWRASRRLVFSVSSLSSSSSVFESPPEPSPPTNPERLGAPDLGLARMSRTP